MIALLAGRAGREQVRVEYLDDLAEFAIALDLTGVPPAVVATAHEQILDTLGVIVGGAQAEPVRQLAERWHSPDGPCWALGLGRRLLPRQAALVNGTAGTWLDFDAGHRWSGGHPAVHVLPAALAVAQARRLSGKELLTAFIAGSEVACRIGLAKGPLVPVLHPHGSWPVFGAVAAVGRLCGITAGEVRRAMELAATLTLATSWNTAFAGATVRHVYAGLGAQLAIQAVEWTLAGWDGEPDGVGVVFGRIAAAGIVRRRATIALGQQWEFATSYLKPYPFARFGHNAIDVLQELHTQHPFRASDVARIVIRVGALGARMAHRHPQNELQARFSLPHAVAVWLARGRLRPEDFRDEALGDPELRALAERVDVSEDPEWEALSPRWRGATVTVVLRDGRTLTGETLYPTGDPEKPMLPEQVREKFQQLVAPVVGAAATAAAMQAVAALATLPTLEPLLEPLAGPLEAEP
ncbi:MAG: hypothetical protein KatS3mg061_0719 [Dehalococcoidia bacterium]|nr:MAG: hypothetical protein KatS3mg061_0719 [Dehalococcoidia bacterium]